MGEDFDVDIVPPQPEVVPTFNVEGTHTVVPNDEKFMGAKVEPSIDPKSAVKFFVSKELREKFNDLVGMDEASVREALEQLKADGEIGSIVKVRLTDPITTEAAPGRVVMTVGFDKKVHSIEME